MNYVIKIKYEDTLRRLTYTGNRPHGDKVGEKLTFAKLEAKIRDLFKLVASAAIRVTYTDKDNDVVTMGDDQDLEDACVLQELNPLRLNVTLVDVKGVNPVECQNGQHPSASAIKEAVPNLKEMLVCLPAEVMRPVVDHVQKLLKGAAASPRQLTELVDTVVNTVTSHIDSAVRNVDPAAHNVTSSLARQSMVDGRFIDDSSLGSSGKLTVPATSVNQPVCSSVQPFNIQNVSIPAGVSTGMPIPTPVPSLRTINDGVPVPRNVIDNEASEPGHACRVFHSGVQCDGCGMNPIVGPRFKSLKNHDYDLCVSCFKDLGNISDYNRIDRPLFRPRHLRCPGLNPNFHAGRGVGLPGRGPYGARPEHLRQGVHQIHGCVGKLDARFVQDVTIFDGTELAPLTSFTKIWRLRNSGTLSWPVETKLVHVGGDELGNVTHVPLELPEKGLPPGEEVEVSVDLAAPEKPGRYVSHWRLASPAGPKFGHRVWVLIQVVCNEGYEDALNVMSPPSTLGTATKEDPVLSGSSKPSEPRNEAENGAQGVLTGDTLVASDHLTGLNSLHTDSDVRSVKLDVPSDLLSESTTPVVDIESHLQVGREGARSVSGGSIASVLISEDNKVPLSVKAEFSSKEEDVNQAVVDGGPSSQKNESVTLETKPVEDIPAFINSELGGFSMVEMPQLVSSSSSDTASPAISVEVDPASSPSIRDLSSSFTPRDSFVRKEGMDLILEDEGAVVGKKITSLRLCENLEGMGFIDRKLNLELLEKNDLDLRRTLDELIAASEWDPILEELEDMGFYDVEMNRRLMFKNNGSVKRVVKELVQMCKEPVGAAKDNGKGKNVA